MADSTTIAIVAGVASAIVSGLLSGGLSVEMYKRKVANDDRKLTEQQKEHSQNQVLSEAQIADRQLYEERLIMQIDKLTLAERALIDERITVNGNVSRLEAKVERQDLFIAEQDDEIQLKAHQLRERDSIIESRDSQIARLQQAVASLTEQLERAGKT
jgi:chromosome segregation ATPase